MKKFGFAIIVVLALIGAVTSAFAAGPPAWAVSVDTGRTEVDLYGNTVPVTNSTIVWLGQPGAGSVGYGLSNPNYYTTSYPAIDIAGTLYAEADIEKANGVYGVIQSKADETRPYYQTTFTLLGAEWGTMLLTVKNSVGFPVILNNEYTNRTSGTFWLSSSERYTYSLTSIPEPSSILAFGSGLVGLGGLALRRRRA